MAMMVTNNLSVYAANNTYATGNSRQAAENKKADETAKTAESKKSQNDKVADYYSKLQKNYDCVRNGKVSISGSYLKECASDYDKAKELEENLSFFKKSCENGYQNAKSYLNSLGDTLNSYSESWSIDEKGNVTMTVSVSGTADAGTKDSKELEEERKERLKARKEREAQQEKQLEKRKKEAERLEETQAEKEDNGTSPGNVAAASKSADNNKGTQVDYSV